MEPETPPNAFLALPTLSTSHEILPIVWMSELTSNTSSPTRLSFQSLRAASAVTFEAFTTGFKAMSEVLIEI